MIVSCRAQIGWAKVVAKFVARDRGTPCYEFLGDYSLKRRINESPWHIGAYVESYGKQSSRLI
jgi:hypothetical protein